MTEPPVKLSKTVVGKMAEEMSIRVLHVDDDASFLKTSKAILEMQGLFQVENAASIKEAREKMKKKEYDAIVSDFQMPEKDSLEFLRELRQKGNTIPFVIFTGKGREEVAIKALNLGADGYFNKTGQPETVYGELVHGIRSTVKSKQAEQALKVSEEKYRSLFANMLNGFAYCRMVFDEKAKPVDFVYLEVNDAFEKLTGLRKEDVIGKKVTEAIPGTEKANPELFDIYSRVALTGKEEKFEIFFKPLDIWLSISVYSPKKGYFVATFEKITERKKVEEQLRDSERKYHELFETSIDAIATSDMDGHFLDCNQSCQIMLGYTLDEMRKLTYQELTPEKWRPMEEKIIREQIMKKGFTVEYEKELIRKDGSTIPVSNRVWATFDENKKPKAMWGILRDVTERKRAEQRFLESQQKFAALFNGNPEATAYTDPDMHILDINPRFTSLFGYGLDEVKGKHLNDVVVPRNLVEEAKMLDERTAKGFVYHDTFRIRKDGSLIPVSVSAAPISIQSRLAGYIATYKDISALKNTEKELKETLRRLEVMNEKLLVVGGLTRHDARNKLTAILGNTYLVKKKVPEDSAVSEYLEEIETSVKQTTAIFEFAKTYESLGVEDLKYIDVEKTIDEAVSLMPDLKGVRIINQCGGLTVLADSLLRQLFYNLIDNSLKYGEKISQIKTSYEETNQGQLKLVYEDDGVGIQFDAKPKLFSRGYTTGKGSGYGLYLIKKMIEVYGWTIEEKGKPGEGARFVIKIPKTSESGKTGYALR